MPIELDHLGLNVSDPEASAAFYERLLGPMGLSRRTCVQGWIGFGAGGITGFWIGRGAQPPQPTHVAFAVPSRRDVDAFYRLALAAGAPTKSPPGLRPEYHASFYSAMVFDPDGHNLELVCHAPPAA